MSEARKMGFMWGTLFGGCLVAGLTFHWSMFLFAPLAFAACISFGIKRSRLEQGPSR